MDLNEERKRASELSLGSSSDLILQNVVQSFLELNLPKDIQLLDVGCGQGSLLGHIKNHGYKNLTGCDYSRFQDQFDFEFFQHDCNLDFPAKCQGRFQCILTSEVIEHLENPWHYARQLFACLDSGGQLVLSTPNPESFLSVLTFLVKGYHNAFGPKDYPAHKTPLSKWELVNIFESAGFVIEDFRYIPNGRIPGSSLLWSSFLPFMKGRLFSDNHILIAKKP